MDKVEELLREALAEVTGEDDRIERLIAALDRLTLAVERMQPVYVPYYPTTQPTYPWPTVTYGTSTDDPLPPNATTFC